MSHNPRTLIVLLLPLFLAGFLSAAEKAKGKKKDNRSKAVVLFDGQSLKGWDYHLVDPNVKMEKVWSVKDGILICKGQPLGYLCTESKYQDFKLTLQWRWAPSKEPGNSGVLLRITGKPIDFMPKCTEAQLMHGSAGDIWGFRGFHVTGPADRRREVKDHESLGNFSGVAAIKDAEKKPGQWNTYRIVLRGDKMKLWINGQLVNEATDCDAVAGKIGLQSEGAEIQFRKIKLVPLD